MSAKTLLPAAAFALVGIMSFDLAAETPQWEARMPAGAETDPIALNMALHGKEIPNRDIVEKLKGHYELRPYAFPGLTPKVASDGLFQAAIKSGSESRYFPDMGGIGPFFLVKAGKSYYALTKRNFALLFSPIEKKSEVLPYLSTFEAIFEGSYGKSMVTADTARQAAATGQTFPKPPAVTQVTEVSDGFRVVFVTYTKIHVEAFFEKTVHVGRDGVVREETAERMLKKIGEGITF